MKKRTVPVLLGALALLGVLPLAQADPINPNDSGSVDVLINDPVLVEGNSARSIMLALPSAGELSIDFADLDFTAPLQTLEFGLSDTSSSVSGMINGDSMTIDFTKSTTCYLDIFAQAGRRTGYGLYSVYAFFQPQVTPVPLPASGFSMAGGLAVLLWAMRRRAQATVMRAVA